MNIQTLNDTFGISGALEFSKTEHDLMRVQITTPGCKAEVYLQGAHLAAWQPAGHGPLLFLSEKSAFEPGKPIRGGVPIIFPWFGAQTATAENPRTDGPAHGFARTAEWQIAFAAIVGEDVHLTLTLGPSGASRELGYDHFQLAYQLTLGQSLRMRLTVANQSSSPLRFEEALHTYLEVGDVQQVRIAGLADTDFLDKTDHFKRKHQTETMLMLTGETDRPYLNTESSVELDDPTLNRRITVAKANSKTTVIWNPWRELSAKLADMDDEGWRTMTCIETANAAENAIVLGPQEVHTMEAHIRVAELEA